MTPQFNALLEDVRSDLESQFSEQDEVPAELDASADGELGPVDVYLSDVADTVSSICDVDEELLLDLLFGTVDDFVGYGILPELPEGEMTAEQETAWVAAAKEVGFKGAVIQNAKMYAEYEEDDS